MPLYQDVTQKSGVHAYEMDENSITVEFKGGAKYKYTVESAGAENITEMKRRATTGEGLNGFIMKNVKDKFAEKIII